MQSLAFFRWRWVLLLGLLLLVSAPVLWIHPMMPHDDFRLMDPLRLVHAFGDYVRLFQENEILDVAPFRDLTYWLELRVEHATGWRNSQLVNLFLWFGAILALERTLATLNVRRDWRTWIIFLIALHPIMANSIDWISGRKHILTALGGITALLFLELSRSGQEKRRLAFSTIALILAFASQPIQVGFVIFALVREARLGWRLTSARKAYFLVLSVATIACAVINVRYFGSEAYMNTGGFFAPKFRAESWRDFESRVLIWGRDAFQLLLPIRPATGSYYLRFWPSIVGLFFLSAAGFSLWRHRRQVAWEWLVFIALPISVVTVKLTSQGGSDTYLLTPLLGLGLFAGVALAQWRPEGPSARMKFYLTAVLIVFALIDVRSSALWISEQSVVESAVENEPSWTSKLLLAKWLVEKPGSDLEWAGRLLDEIPVSMSNPSFGLTRGRWIQLLDRENAEKTRLFEEKKIDQVWYDVQWSYFDASIGKFEQAHRRLKDRWERDPRAFGIATSQALSSVGARWRQICESAGASDCDRVTAEIRAEIERQKNSPRF